MKATILSIAATLLATGVAIGFGGPSAYEVREHYLKPCTRKAHPTASESKINAFVQQTDVSELVRLATATGKGYVERRLWYSEMVSRCGN